MESTPAGRGSERTAGGESASCDEARSLDAVVAEGSLAASLARWTEVAARLRLDDAARMVGAVLLSAELDGKARARIMGAHADTTAPRRCDLLDAVAAFVPEGEATAGLVAIEERGVASPIRGSAGPWLSVELELDRRVRAYCVAATGASPPAGDGEAHALPRVEAALREAAARCAREGGRVLVVLRGRSGSGRDFALRRLVTLLGTRPLRRSVHELRQPVDTLEPELSGLAPIWDPRRTDPSPDDYDIARRWLSRSKTMAVAMLDRHQDAPDVEGRIVVLVDVDPIDVDERRAGWEAALAQTGAPRPVAEAAADRLGRRNRGGAGLATRAALMIGDRSFDTTDALIDAAEHQIGVLTCPSTMRGILIERPSVPLSRIVAPDAIVQALKRLVLLAQLAPSLRNSGRVGVKAILSGSSGTGKTMAARALATELRLPLYRVDLSSVVSKWVGETEKNLREVMTAAEAAGAVLLFDEGEAMFGKRGEVTRGADRYANTEVAYLLQAVEAYDGIAIVTTNLRGNIDRAFERRFDVSLEIPPPAAEERELIWRQELGEAGDGLPDEVIADVARRADLAGGGIAAAVRMARVLALHEGRARVSQLDLHRAVRGEVLKSGSTVQASRWADDR